MDIRKWLKKPETTPSASLRPGSRSTGQAEEHLPRPSTSKRQLELRLGVDKPVQVCLKQFPKKQQHNNDCKRLCSAKEETATLLKVFSCSPFCTELAPGLVKSNP
ncbi:Zinc finger MYM-type protein 1 [Scomber scombrus]|uniref:Zinc finger MYM-type protein 1 n=1 Tax=Scomber scombrus TaxID=13677 RepID=A0AAV1PC51_SCOSC